MSELIIRPFEEGDLEQVKNLHTKGLKQVKIDLKDSHWDKHFDNIESRYGDGAFLVGEIRGKIVAMAGLKRISDTDASPEKLRVDPDFQNHGYGKKMHEAREKKAIELGFNKLLAGTSAQQEAAVGILRKRGYQEITGAKKRRVRKKFLKQTKP